MTLFHLYLYFLVLVSVFKTKRDWAVFFHVTIATSIVVSYVALLQKLGYRRSIQGGFRVDSTIGNPTYLAAYLLFHVWLLLLYIREYWRTWWRAGLYILVLLFELAIVYFTATRGAIIALVLSTILFLALLAWRWPKGSSAARHMRTLLGGVLVAAILIPLFFWQVRDTQFVQSNQTLRRLTNYSLTEGTVQARFMIWGMSWQGFLKRPILGWGQENYYLVFQKYFNPGLYGNEPWFDRSHNVFFDWLIHGGILGLLSYFAVLGAAFFALIRAVRRSDLPLWDGLVLAALFFTYIVQNIFVFDNLNTYLLYFGFLGYTHFRAEAPSPSVSSRPSPLMPEAQLYGITAAFLVIVVASIYFLNIKPMRQSQALIRAMGVYRSGGGADQVITGFREALSHNSFGDLEVREQLGNVTREFLQSDRGSEDDKRKVAAFAVEELRKEVTKSARDVKHLLFLGSLMNQSLPLNPAYAPEAEQILTDAVKVSPTKQIVYFELAQFYLLTEQLEKAVQTLEAAWNLEHRYQEAGVNLWLVAVVAKKPEIVARVREVLKIEDLGEQSLNRLSVAYRRVGEFGEALKIFEYLVKIYPKNAQHRATYAALLANAGRIKEAEAEVREAARLDPSLEKESEEFLRSLGR